MPGCDHCDEYMPRFEAMMKAYQKVGVPFQVVQPNVAITDGAIPVAFYDASSADAELQAFCDRVGVSGTPLTVLMTRRGMTKHEGAVDDNEIAQILTNAHQANRGG